ncbi:MAG: hypothetical protein P8Q55_06005 [Candidatus Poseidoniaceae archaeon]|nr:hypothetical protein [Candidatus Poseidoniaceae archaeon]
MSVDRSGEIIPAGIAPSKITSTQNAFDRIHRGTSFILAIDTLIIVIFFSGMVVNALIGSSLENLSQYFIILPGIAGGLIWTAYRRTNRWAYWPSAGIIALASLFFGLLTLYDIWKFIQGDFGSLIMALLLGWATFGSIRRVRYHFHPGYKAAYLSEFDSSDDEIELEEGEMLAACSSCFAVLAIRPNMLSADDRCPHCNNRLVSNRTASKYNEEE